jgi:hypothetical protein
MPVVKDNIKKVESAYKFWMNFNGKQYMKGSYSYSTKEEAKKEANQYRKNGINTIIDKRKDGYFFWIREPRGE